MLIDCFMYYDEREALKIRLHELDDIADKFVIVEGARSFRGGTKPWYLDQVWNEIAPWHDRIHRVPVIHYPQTNDPWELERFQRDQITRGLVEINSAPDDILLVSDADEIPNANTVKRLNLHAGVVHLEVNTYYFRLDWKVPDRWNQGGRPFAVIKQQMGSPQEMRDGVKRFVLDGGWHFSYLGSSVQMQNKIKAFAHSEYDTPEYTDLLHLEECARLGKDPFYRFDLEPVEIDETYPQWVQENQDSLGHLLRRR